jgi:hypothetical protein
MSKTKVVHTEAWVGIVEDVLDLIMMLGSLIYIALVYETGFELSPQTMAAIGGAAGTLRLLARRLAKKIVQLRLEEKS